MDNDLDLDLDNDLDLDLGKDLDLDLGKEANKIKIICILLNNNCIENIVQKKIIYDFSFIDQNIIFKFLNKLFANSKKLVNYSINDYNIKYVLNYNLDLDVDNINELEEDVILDDSSMYLLQNNDLSVNSMDTIQQNFTNNDTFDITDCLFIFLNKKYNSCYIRNNNKNNIVLKNKLLKNNSKKFTKKVNVK